MANPLINAIAQDIVAKARQRGVDPRFALGVAFREGLNPNTVNSPTFGNPDAKGYSYGPWQLYSGSPQPGSVAPGGMAAQFAAKYGERPSASNWQKQNDFAIGLMAGKNPASLQTTWYAIRDAGGPDAIRSIGEQKMRSLGLMNGGGNMDTSPAAMAPQGFTPTPPTRPGDLGAPMDVNPMIAQDAPNAGIGGDMAGVTGQGQGMPDYMSQFGKFAGMMGGGGGGGQPQIRPHEFNHFAMTGNPSEMLNSGPAQPVQMASIGGAQRRRRRGLLG